MADNTYSRFVQVAKVALPLVALSLLSTLFLVSRTINPEDAIPFADIDVEQMAKEQSLAAPKFSGMTSDGSTISVTAERARPDLTDPRRLSATNVAADILTTSGTQILVLADDALYDGNSNTLTLTGRVRFNTSTGYELQTDALEADLGVTRLTAPGSVSGFAPAGTLDAGSMELTGEVGSQLLHFKNGVKLVYDPQD
jgi:lipopolysaccharide export system protein LptC